MKNYTTFVTHSSVFHADECMATAILRHAFIPLAKIVRTLNISQYLDDEEAIIYDIGLGMYDHHQKGGNGKREISGTPYAACGLIWRDFGERCIINITSSMKIHLTDDDIFKIKNIIDFNIIEGIDAADNGYIKYEKNKDDIHYFNINNIISALNTISYDGGVQSYKQYDNFITAVELCEKILISNIRRFADSVSSEKEIKDKISSRSHKNILVLDKYSPWANVIWNDENATDIYYVIFPSPRGGWNMQAVTVAPDTYEQRHTVPKSWWGASKEELPIITGVEGVTFCHQSNGFLTAADTKEAIIKLAEIAAAADPE